MQIKLKKQHRRYSKYKNTGLPWLGEVPENWDIGKIKYFSNIQFSSVDKHIFDDEKQVSVCNYTDVYYGEIISDSGNFRQGSCTPTEYQKYKIRKGDVIITKDSESADDIAIPAYISKDFENVVCGYHLALIRTSSKGLWGNFLFRFFQSDRTRKYFELNANGITRFGLGKAKIENLFTPIPSKKEQETIADYLDEKTALLDRTIEAKRKQIELLKEKRNSLINHIITQGINKGVEMKKSGTVWIGKIPKHWEIKPLFSIAKEQSNKNIENKVQNVLSLSYGNIVRRDVETNFGLLPESFETYQIVQPENIILRLTDLQNDKKSLRVGFVKEIGIITSAYVCLFVREKILPRYLYSLLHSYDLEKVFYSLGAGVRQTMKFSDLKRLPIPIPPKDEQKEIVAFLDSETQKIDQTIALIEKSITLLEEYKTSLISNVVTGKINVMTS